MCSAAIRGRSAAAERIEADLSQLDEAGAERARRGIGARLGPLDILVNNAGIIRRAEALDHRWADWRAVMAVNLDCGLAAVAGGGAT